MGKKSMATGHASATISIAVASLQQFGDTDRPATRSILNGTTLSAREQLPIATVNVADVLTMWQNMNKLLIGYWREWRPDILRWIAAIVVFALFAWIMVDYYDYFDHFR